jgi:hypothetical protein
MVLQKRYGVSAILLSTESQDVIDELVSMRACVGAVPGYESMCWRCKCYRYSHAVVSIRPGMRVCLCWRCKCYKYGYAGVMLYAVELCWSYLYAGVVLELCWSSAAVMLRIALWMVWEYLWVCTCYCALNAVVVIPVHRSVSLALSQVSSLITCLHPSICYTPGALPPISVALPQGECVSGLQAKWVREWAPSQALCSTSYK